MKLYKNKEELRSCYNELQSLSAVAKHYGVSKKLILNYMNKFDLPRKSMVIKFDDEELIKRFESGENIISIAKSQSVSVPTIRKMFSKHGIETDRFHVGYKTKTNGYTMIMAKDHPNADASGYVLKHRLIVEKHIGRYLTKTEVIHHKDFNKYNNEIDNLEILSATEHANIHSPVERKIIDISLAKQMLMSGMKQKEVAKCFNINVGTLRAKLKRHGLYHNDKI